VEGKHGEDGWVASRCSRLQDSAVEEVFRAFTIVSLKFGSSVGPVVATSACEPNFRFASHTLCIVKLTTFAH